MKRLLVLVFLLGCAPADGSGGSGEISTSDECIDFCDVRLLCDPDLDPEDSVDRDSCLLSCNADFLSAASINKDFCPMLLREVFVCVAALDSCDAYLGWWERDPSPYACQDQESEYCLQCGGCS